MPDVSIAISAKDNFSDAITTMRNANQSFNKDLTGTMEKLDVLNKNKVTLKVEVDKARSALRDAEKQFAATGSAADKMALEIAGADYDNAKRNIDLLAKNARQAEHDILNMTDAVSKADNRVSRSDEGSGILKRLAGAGLGQMFGQSLQGAAETYATSMLGSAQGNAFGSVLGSTVTGAAMGSVAGPVGTAIGAAVGAVAGGINAAAQTYQGEDEAFKSTVQNSYNAIQQERENTLQSGSSIAGSREQTQMAFAQRLGNDKAAEEYLDKTKTMARETNYTFDEITGYSKKLLNSYKPDEVFSVLQTLSDASAGLNLNSSDVNMFISGLSRMRTTGKATQEYLNYFSERGVDVYKAIGDAVGVDKSKIAGMITKGKISGNTAAKAITDYINSTFGGLSKKLATTYDAMKDNLQDVQDDINASMGEGYNSERKKGLRVQTDWLSGKNGAKMSDAYSMIGSWKAFLENTKEKMIRDSMNKAMNEDPEYQRAKAFGDRAKMGEILAKAQIDGENNYKATQGYQTEIESEKSMIQSIQEDTALNDMYWKTGYDQGQLMSQGRAAAQQRTAAKNSSSDSFSRQYANYNPNSIAGRVYNPQGNGSAVGISRVPYNNFPALLHEDEQVLTGAEARSKAALSGVKVEVTGPVTVRKESDIDDIASRLFDKIKTAALITP